jgi:tetratricopeptide (TPR) repeat protein
MNARGLPVTWKVAAVSAFALVLHAPSVRAQDADPALREAAKHFERGVGLYGEANYRGALVEFKRASTLAPNVAVLYNIGETQYQLQDYAGALTTFERYLADVGPNDGHRAEVESNVAVLRTRVGRITITSSPSGAAIAIDEQGVGHTPFDESVRVSIGHHKVVAAMPGRAPVTRYVDVAAEDEVSVRLELAAPDAAASASALNTPASADGASAGRNGSAGHVLGWLATGALAAGAVTFGLLANKESHDLEAARHDAFPTTKSTLDHDANRVTTYAVIADSLGAAALIVGGLNLYWTLASSADTRAQSGGTRVGLGLGSAHFEATF